MTPSSAKPSVSAVLVNDTRVDRHHGCTRVMRAIEHLCAANGIRILAAVPAHRDWRKDAAYLAALDRSALVIVNGEGTIHHDRPMGRLLLEAGAEARARGKASALINFSWQANGPALAELLADFDIVAARESRSFAEIRGARPDCRLVPDLSLHLPVRPSAERLGVGFSDSVVRHTRFALRRARRRFRAQALPIRFAEPGPRGLARFLRSFVSRDDLRRPTEIGETLASMAEQARGQTRSDETFTRRLAALELLVSGRFHAVTLALAAGTPVLAVGSNTHKIEALLDDAGLAQWRIVDPSDLDAALIDRAKRWEAGEAERLERYLAEGRAATARLFADIRGLVR